MPATSAPLKRRRWCTRHVASLAISRRVSSCPRLFRSRLLLPPSVSVSCCPHQASSRCDGLVCDHWTADFGQTVRAPACKGLHSPGSPHDRTSPNSFGSRPMATKSSCAATRTDHLRTATSVATCSATACFRRPVSRFAVTYVSSSSYAAATTTAIYASAGTGPFGTKQRKEGVRKLIAAVAVTGPTPLNPKPKRKKK